jgi:hypothetical protein
MNRAARRAVGCRVNVVSTALVCESCGESWIHTEIWEGDDLAHGVPLDVRCDCGGFVFPAARSPEGSGEASGR